MMRAVVGTLSIAALCVGIALLGGYCRLGYSGGLCVGLLLGVWVSYLCEKVG